MTALRVTGKQVRRDVFVVGLLATIFLILRTIGSMNRFPADPGYDYILSAELRGMNSWFNLDPYLHFGAHFLSWLSSLLPIQIQAVGLSLLSHSIWVLASIGIYIALWSEGLNRTTRFAGALSLILIPVAAESGLGNVGNIKWPLMALSIVLASTDMTIRYPRSTSVILILSGLTNPLLLIALVPIALRFRISDPLTRKRLVPIALVITSTFVVQAFLVGLGGLGKGRGDSRILSPWPEMGLFWWYGLLGPVLLIVGYFIGHRIFKNVPHSFALSRIALTVPVLVVASYIYGGIADRYFIAPMVLAWIVTISLILAITKPMNVIGRIFITGAVLVAFGLPTVKWFSASWYLTSGPTWSEEINRATDDCNRDAVTVVVQVGAGNMTELDCSYILQNS